MNLPSTNTLTQTGYYNQFNLCWSSGRKTVFCYFHLSSLITGEIYNRFKYVIAIYISPVNCFSHTWFIFFLLGHSAFHIDFWKLFPEYLPSGCLLYIPCQSPAHLLTIVSLTLRKQTFWRSDPSLFSYLTSRWRVLLRKASLTMVFWKHPLKQHFMWLFFGLDIAFAYGKNLTLFFPDTQAVF